MVMCDILVLLVVVSCSSVHAADDPRKHELYFLSMLPYADPEPALNPVIALGADLFPAVLLAVDHVNNRSDVLGDYRIQVIEADGGCDISSKALISLTSQLYHTEKQVVGIIGPACSDSAQAVGAVINRGELALCSIHLGSSYLLEDRNTYKYTVGMAESSLAYTDFLLFLINELRWTQVAFLYHAESLIDYSVFVNFERRSKNETELVFSDYTNSIHIPLEAVRNSLTRVIFTSLRPNIADMVLCMAYHKKMLYPTYQWILIASIGFPGGIGEVHFKYAPENREYSCSYDEMVVASEAVISFVGADDDSITSDTTTTASGLTKVEIITIYRNAWATYNNQQKQAAPVEDVYVHLAYDSVWALALAMNSSLALLQEKNSSFFEYTYGKPEVSEVILDQLYQLDFSGLSGVVDIDPSTGFRNVPRPFFQYRNGSITKIGNRVVAQPIYGFNLSQKLISVDSEFRVEKIHVELGLAVTFVLIIVLTGILVASLHVLNSVYGDYKTIKASSSRLNHFAYIGCYSVLFALLLYTVVETIDLGSVNPTVTSVLCNALPWFTSIGFSLIFGTVMLKTLRIYIIFTKMKRMQRVNYTYLKDPVMSAFIVSLLVIDILFCTLWCSVDPLKYGSETRINVEDATQEVEEFCTSDFYTLWIGLIALYEGTLIAFAVFLAILSQKVHMKEFHTNHVITLAYLFFFVAGIGTAVLFITTILNVNVNVSYTVLCLTVTSLVYLCWFFLFLPPIFPLLKEKFYRHEA